MEFRVQIDLVLDATDIDQALFKLAMHLLEASQGSDSGLDYYQVGNGSITVMPTDPEP